jgi:hypothetical protein
MAKDTATKIKPKSTKNLAAYGLPSLSWERALERLQEEWKVQAPPEMGGDAYPHTHWLATTRPDGRPHVVPIDAVWDQGHFYFTAADSTRKAKNLAENARCVMSLAAKDLDITLEGEARKIEDEDKLKHLADVFASGGWAPEVRDGAFYHEYSAPSAGPPPWFVYEFAPKTVFAVATAEPYGATRWRF